MPKISREALREVEEALRRWELEVKASGVRAKTAKTYILHPTNFVRWLKDDFEPGGTLSN